MEISLSSGQLSYETPDGTTGVVNLADVTTTEIIIGHTYSAGAPTAQAMIVNKPVITPTYLVILHMADWRTFVVYLGTVTNQATWLNTLSGAEACVSDIETAQAI